MQFVVKLIITVFIIIIAAHIGKKSPALGGLIATMPLTGAIVLGWLYLDNPYNFNLFKNYARSALWGTIPSIFFFITAYFCFKKQLPFLFVILLSFFTWFIGALLHYLFLQR